MKHIFKKRYTTDLDWSTLETSEEDSTQLINAIADGNMVIAVYQPEDSSEPTADEDEAVLSDPIELFNAPIQPHLLHESS